ncbi:MAG: S41 family peptidase [Sphingomicrobium sp.]
MKAWAVAAAAAFIASPAAAAAFDPAPWLADLKQAREAFHEKYANWYWLETEHELKIDPLFDDVAERLRNARSEAAAKVAFDRLVRKVGDGHVEIDWPDPPDAMGIAPAGPKTADLCTEIGYDSRQNGKGTARALAGYEPLPGDNPFDAGTVTVAGTKIGVLRIGIFQPQGYPELCRSAVRELSIPPTKPCDDRCQDDIVTWAYQRLTEALEDRIRALKAAGATALLVDITNNGGGSEWAEAAARSFSPRQLVSERRGFVRGIHWAKQWQDLANDLREHAKKAGRADKPRLLDWAVEADAARHQAQMPCPAGSKSCAALGTAGYSTGLVGSARAGAFAGKDWGVLVFNPAQFPYHDGVWSGPLIVLVDQETWSAAEEFAAVLQDNKAAVIIGARTGGAGCGHTNGGTPTTLRNSGAILKLPDCVRFRADGSNEVRGIIPDETVAIRADDGAQFRANLIAEKLPSAIARARALLAQ